MLAAVNAPDSVVVYAALRPARKDVVLPRWYLQAALTEIISRFPAIGVRYDPLLDVRLPLTVTTTFGARASASLGQREIVVTSLTGDARPPMLGTLTARVSGATVAGRATMPPLSNEADIMMDSALQMRAEKGALLAAAKNRPMPLLAASATSVLTHLASAIAAAQRDSAFPPMPEGSGDSISLVLELRPGIGSRPALADSNAAILPLFRAAQLHRERATDALYDGEVDVGARLERRSRLPRWPSGKSDAQGGVLIELAVDTTGRVDPAQLRVLEATPGFGDSVLETVRKWRYTPAQISGCSVRSLVAEAVLFRLAGQ
ncbi:MAG: TonB family protein [Gemmatimonadaceae bacterium]